MGKQAVEEAHHMLFREIISREMIVLKCPVKQNSM